MYSQATYSQATYSQLLPLPDTEVAVEGVSATGALGTVSLVTNNFLSVTGVLATGGIGSVTILQSSSVTLEGVSAGGGVGVPLLWQEVDDSQDATWVDIPN